MNLRNEFIKGLTVLTCVIVVLWGTGVSVGTTAQAAEVKTTTVKLEKGSVQVFDYGSMKMYVYETKDIMNDYVIVVEKDGKGVIIESPAFFDNYSELKSYLSTKSIKFEGIIIPYHPLGATFIEDDMFSGVEVYSTGTMLDFFTNREGAILKSKISAGLGDKGVDLKFYQPTILLKDGAVEIAGIEFIITDSYDGFDIEIPEIKTVYMHILGHDAHSEMFSRKHLEKTIETLKLYQSKGYETFLSSHYNAENNDDAVIKIEYLEGMKRIASSSKTRDEFYNNMKAAYPDYDDRYLTPTADFFYK